MPELTNDAVLECLAEALESSAFISIEPPPDEVAIPDRPELLSLRFSGRVAGEVQIAVPSSFGAVLAASILALDASSQEALNAAQDAVKELCNVTAGGLLNRLFDESEGLPEMALPEARPMTPDEWAQFTRHTNTSVVFAEGMPLAVRATMEQVA